MIVKANEILTTAVNFEKSFPGNFFPREISREKSIVNISLRIEISRIIKFDETKICLVTRLLFYFNFKTTILVETSIGIYVSKM